MIPKFSSLTACGAMLAVFVACGPTPPSKSGAGPGNRVRAHELAVKAYTDLVNKYPDSEFAQGAQARLAALGPAPAVIPAAKK